MITAEALGSDRKSAIKTAAAMQVSEDWLLIHDDFEDNSSARRGKPTLHKIYGPELAVNAGDLLHVIMWKIIQDNRKLLGENKTFEIAEEFYKILLRTTHGQGVEIAWSKKGKSKFNDQDWFFIADGKTAYYTIAGPLRLGGIIAGASDKQIKLLTQFGLKLGRCFQLVDDLLDVTSEYKGAGQKRGNDIYEGKKTLILGHLLRSANRVDREKISFILGKESKTENEVDWILNKMNEYESIKYARSMAEYLKEEAEGIFEKDLKFLSHEPARTNIGKLIRFILERKY